MKLVCLMFVIAAGMRSDQHKAEESMKVSSASATSATGVNAREARQLSSDVPKIDFGIFEKQAQTVAQESINSIKRFLGSTAKGGVCPKEFRAIPDGYDYGVGCALKDLIDCSCPSFLDVCATSPRSGKVEDFKDWMIKLSVSQLGYCRTGAWVFILSAVLLVVALAGIAFCICKKRR